MRARLVARLDARGLQFRLQGFQVARLRSGGHDEASRRLLSSVDQRLAHLGHVGAHVVDLHVQIDVGGDQRDERAGDQCGQQTRTRWAPAA